jgi:hypothetical protein
MVPALLGLASSLLVSDSTLMSRWGATSRISPRHGGRQLIPVPPIPAPWLSSPTRSGYSGDSRWLSARAYSYGWLTGFGYLTGRVRHTYCRNFSTWPSVTRFPGKAWLAVAVVDPGHILVDMRNMPGLTGMAV